MLVHSYVGTFFLPGRVDKQVLEFMVAQPAALSILRDAIARIERFNLMFADFVGDAGTHRSVGLVHLAILLAYLYPNTAKVFQAASRAPTMHASFS